MSPGSLTGTGVGQALAAILGALAVTGEYGTGMIRTTLAAVPRRTAMLTAKAADAIWPVRRCG